VVTRLYVLDILAVIAVIEC